MVARGSDTNAVQNRARAATAPLYLFACLLIGMIVRPGWPETLAQAAGLVIIAWAAAAPQPSHHLTARAKQVLSLAFAAVVLVLLQEIPLPGSAWAVLARAHLTQASAIAGEVQSTRPISLVPLVSLRSLLSFIPPFAIFLAIVRLRAFRIEWLVIALLAGAAAGIVAIALEPQTGRATFALFYPVGGVGAPESFGARADDIALLIVITLPFIATIAPASGGRRPERYSGLLLVSAGLALLMIAGLLAVGSRTGYVVAVPTLAASALISFRFQGLQRKTAMVVTALLALGAAAALMITTPVIGSAPSSVADTFSSRQLLLARTAKAALDKMPFGSGLGSFARVFPAYSSTDGLLQSRLTHAQNDYAEVSLELGLGGDLVVIIFLAWWVAAARAAWTANEAEPFARAASVASAAMLIQSLVGWPLRTAAISASFAMCIALLSERRAASPAVRTDLRPTRHLVFD